MILYIDEAKSREQALSKCLEKANANASEVLSKEEEIAGSLFKSTKYKVTVVTKEEIKKEMIDFFIQLGNLMKISIEPTVTEDDNIFKIYLESTNNSILIGKDGRTLKSIQILLKQSLLSKTGMNVKTSLDISGYKEKKMKHLENTVRRVASEVIHSKIDAKLDPMNSYERRFVHTIISEYTMLKTESVGEDPQRCVVISYKQD